MFGWECDLWCLSCGLVGWVVYCRRLLVYWGLLVILLLVGIVLLFLLVVGLCFDVS